MVDDIRVDKPGAEWPGFVLSVPAHSALSRERPAPKGAGVAINQRGEEMKKKMTAKEIQDMPSYRNEIGDKCYCDSVTTFKDGKKTVFYAEVDGMHFDSSEYRTKKAWLNAIIRRVYQCAMGELN